MILFPASSWFCYELIGLPFPGCWDKMLQIFWWTTYTEILGRFSLKARGLMPRLWHFVLKIKTTWVGSRNSRSILTRSLSLVLLFFISIISIAFIIGETMHSFGDFLFKLSLMFFAIWSLSLSILSHLRSAMYSQLLHASPTRLLCHVYGVTLPWKISVFPLICANQWCSKSTFWGF